MRAILYCAAAALLTGPVLSQRAEAQETEIRLRPSIRIQIPDWLVRNQAETATPQAPEPEDDSEVEIPAAMPEEVPAEVPVEPDMGSSPEDRIDANRPPDRIGRSPTEGPPSVSRPRVAPSIRYNLIKVLGTGFEEFYYVRQDIFLDLTEDDRADFRKVLHRNFGPHPVGASVPVTAGANYVIFPSCRGNIALDTRRLARLPVGQLNGVVRLSCPA
jgi:hypothetical protein